MSFDRNSAQQLDHDDPLAGYRDRFVIPDDSLIYLDGNSLGRQAKASRDRVREVLDDEWAAHLIRSWDDHWLELPTRIGDLIAATLLGVGPGQVVVDGSTTVALYKAITAALDARPERRVIVIEEDNFPTDRYVVESLAAQRGLEVRWIPAAGLDGIAPDDVRRVLSDDVAVTVLCHVDCRSAAIVDLGAITAAVHDVGALALWDLCHSAGAVPIDLSRDDVDLAVGCTYKYLNGGPGSPAYTYVRADLHGELRQPIWGWWGRQEMFEMGLGYVPEPGIKSWLTGTASVLSLAGVEPAVAMVGEAGVPAIRAKSRLLTALAVDLYDEILAPLGWRLASPRDPDRRGGHVTVTRPGARDLMQPLAERNVLPDYRRPDGIRLGLSPLTTRFVDVYDGLQVLADLS